MLNKVKIGHFDKKEVVLKSGEKGKSGDRGKGVGNINKKKHLPNKVLLKDWI